MNSNVGIISLLKLKPEWKSIRLKTENIIIKNILQYKKKPIGLEPSTIFYNIFYII